jgi:hypothetical protein
MKYDVEMASSGMIYKLCFMKISSVVQKLFRGILIETREHTHSKVIS